MEQPAFAGQALEPVAAVVLELDVGSFEQLAHGRRDDDFAMARRLDHPRRGVNGQAADVAIGQLDLASVHSGAAKNWESTVATKLPTTTGSGMTNPERTAPR